jgi:hypothetical protein
MGTYSALRDKKNQLIRKARDGSVFIAPYSAPTIANLTTNTSGPLTPLPTGWTDLGHISTDGASFGRDTAVSDVRSFGSTEPTRSDMTSDTITMQCTAQETNINTLQLYTGADLSATMATAVTGEFQIAKPAIPGFKFWRILGLFVDYTDDGELYMGRYMPRTRVTELGEQAFADGDDPIQYQVTFTGFEDATLGYSHKWLFGGPGWLALLSDMGIDIAP